MMRGRRGGSDVRTAVAVAAVWLTLAATTRGGPIVIRHDREDRDYAAAASDYPYLARVGPGHGTLVAPTWVLTAAHVAQSLDPFFDVVEIAGAAHRVRQVVLHPSWRGDLEPGLAELDWIDLALIELEHAVDGVTPAGLYTGQDEQGRLVTFVGEGGTGDGVTGPAAPGGTLRVATNVVERVDPDWLYFTFDAPPHGTELEGISGPGDSGGPALLTHDGRAYVIGVSSRNDDHGRGQCVYHTTDVYVRVSGAIGWVRRVLRGEASTLRALAPDDWPTGPGAVVARAFLIALSSGDPKELAEFERRFRDPQQLRAIDAESRARAWIDQRDRWGSLLPVWIATPGPNRVAVLVRDPEARVFRSLRLVTTHDDPPQLRELRVSRGDPITSVRSDDLRSLRRELADASGDSIDANEVHALGERALRLAYDAGGFDALRVLSDLCRDGPSQATRGIRRRALAVTAAQAAESLRTRTLLTTGFVPPLRHTPDDQQEQEVAAYEASLRSLPDRSASPSVLVDCEFARLSLRIALDRWRPLPWHRDADRTAVRRDLNALLNEVEGMEAPSGGSYADAIHVLLARSGAVAFGDVLPSVARPTTDGGVLDLADLRGRVVVLTFWNSWCVPCMKAIPDERALVEQLAGAPFTFLGVSSDPNASQAQATAARHEMPWINLWDPGAGDESLGDLFRVEAWPSAVILDRHGRVRFKFQPNLLLPAYDISDVAAAARSLLDES